MYNRSRGDYTSLPVEPERSDEDPRKPRVCPACNSRYEPGVVFCPKDGTRLEAESADRSGRPTIVGKVIADRYRVVRKLGEGGMGEVFEATHIYLDKAFALKLLRPEITANPEAVVRFHQEARSAASIGHDNIVNVEDFGRLPDGSVYLAMELLRGRSLAERLRVEPPLSTEECLGFALQVCEGLAAAHAKGIVHRDMKPENVFLTEKQGLVICKILDFGIAKVTGEGSSSLTRTGAIFGTPHYMSPEQALGKSLDHRADIYSLGVILFEMATGRVPYQAESFMGILTQHITAPIPSPSKVAPERAVPPPLEAVILRAMAKEPADRYATMEELGAELVRIAGDLAPGLLAPRSSSALLAVRPPSGAVPVRPPTGASPARAPSASMDARPATSSVPPGAVPSSSALPAATEPGMGADLTLADAGAEKKRGPWLALGVGAGALALGFGGVLAWLMATRAPSLPPVETVVVREAPKAPKAPNVAPAEVELLLDTVPSGASIGGLPDEKADTPEVVKVAPGRTIEVTLHKAGYLDKRVTLDAADGPHKVIVPLEAVAKEVEGKHAPLPHLPAGAEAPAEAPHHPAKPEAPALQPPTVEHAPAQRPAVPPPPTGDRPVVGKPTKQGPKQPVLLDPY